MLHVLTNFYPLWIQFWLTAQWVQETRTFGFPKMVLSRALDNDNQAFRRPADWLTAHSSKTFLLWKSNTCSTKWLFQINMYQSWFRYRRYWIQFWSVTGDDLLMATSLYMIQIWLNFMTIWSQVWIIKGQFLCTLPSNLPICSWPNPVLASFVRVV